MQIPMMKGDLLPTNNFVTARSVYGGASGPTVGQSGSGLTPYGAGAAVGGVSQSGVIGADGQTQSATAAASSASLAATPLLGQPVTWWLVLVVIVFGVMFLVRKYAGEGDRAVGMIKPTITNMFAITGNAVIGIVILKVALNKWHVPGLTTLINAV